MSGHATGTTVQYIRVTHFTWEAMHSDEYILSEAVNDGVQFASTVCNIRRALALYCQQQLS